MSKTIQGFLEYWIVQQFWISAEPNGKDLAKTVTNNICLDCTKKSSGQNFITPSSITPDLQLSKVTSMYLVKPASSSGTTWANLIITLKVLRLWGNYYSRNSWTIIQGVRFNLKVFSIVNVIILCIFVLLIGTHFGYNLKAITLYIYL